MKTDTGLMEGRQKASRADPAWVIRNRQNRMSRIAKVMSGELEESGGVVAERVVLSEQPLAYTDGKVITLPANIDEDPRLNLLMQEAILAHEAAGHHRYTDFDAWFKACEAIRLGHEDGALHTFVNIVEDARVNHLLAQDFPGSGKRLDVTQGIMMRRHVEHWSKTGVSDPDAHQAAIVALMTEAIVAKPHFFTHERVVDFMDEVRPMIENAISQPDTQGVIKQARRMLKVFRKHFPEDENNCNGSSENPAQNGHGQGVMTDDMSPSQIQKMKEAQEAAGQEVEKVSKARFNDLERPEEGPSAGEGEEGSDGDESGNSEDSDCDGDGDGSGDGDSDGDSDGQGSEGKADRDGATNGEGEGERSDSDERVGKDPGRSERGPDADVTVTPNPEGGGAPCSGDGSIVDPTVEGDLDWDIDALFSEAVEALEDENLISLHNAADWDNDAENSWDDGLDMVTGRDDTGHHIEVICTTHEMNRRSGIDVLHHAERYDEIVNENRQGIKQLVKEIQRNIKGRNTLWTTGYKRGRLDSNALWKHETNNRLFKRRNVPHVPQADVLILIDASGSMGCNESGKTRAQWASEAAVVLTEALDQLNFNHEVVDFNSEYGGGAGSSTIRVRRQSGASLSAPVKAAVAAPYVGSQNSDGNCLQWAADRVRRMGRGFKFVFVISDGAPCGPSPAGVSANDHLKQVVRGLKAEGDVEVFSIGIAGMDTSAYYENAVRVVNTASLADESLPVLRGLLKRAIKKQGVVQ